MKHLTLRLTSLDSTNIALKLSPVLKDSFMKYRSAQLIEKSFSGSYVLALSNPIVKSMSLSSRATPMTPSSYPKAINWATKLRVCV